MHTSSTTSDGQLLELLRRDGAMSVSQMAAATAVTATAVRQRLSRLMGEGLIERDVARAGRGRPSHRYSLTDKARRQAGNNFSDLAVVLWDEIRAVKDQEVRRGLLERIATAMAAMYRESVGGTTLSARLESLRRLFGERRVPIDVSGSDKLPVLTVAECPYPELAEKDRGICAVEKMLFAKLLDQPVRLSQCRLDGHNCCQFETN
ncbi:MAG: AsnC family transcriptional regulator [Planctomycetia bacterium]|nr:AsnC family transcriptional regulator [Planctomycetia bacterium]